MPVKTIGVKRGVRRGTASEFAHRDGVSVRTAVLGDELRTRAASLYADGMTLAQVAQYMGVGDEAVRKAVLAEGSQIQPRGRRPVRTRRGHPDRRLLTRTGTQTVRRTQSRL